MSMPLAEKNSNSSLGGKAGDLSRLRDTAMEANIAQTEKLPNNFGEVVHGVYRSAFPQPCHFPAMKRLGLKMIVTFVEGDYTQEHQMFLKENGIEHRRIPIQANKDPGVRTPDSVVNHVMEILLNKTNHPILVHCNKGRHRTGCIIACFRKLQGRDLETIIEEYTNYSWPKSRALDVRFIELFDHTKLMPVALSIGAHSWPGGALHGPSHDEAGQDENTPKRRVLKKPDVI